MVKNFLVELAGTQFRFNTLSSKTLQAFQVYHMQDGKQQRFHMQINGNGSFFITDPEHCPKDYVLLEVALSNAIFDNQDAKIKL